MGAFRCSLFFIFVLKFDLSTYWEQNIIHKLTNLTVSCFVFLRKLIYLRYIRRHTIGWCGSTLEAGGSKAQHFTFLAGKNASLLVSFNDLLCSPRSLGFHDPIWRAYFRLVSFRLRPCMNQPGNHEWINCDLVTLLSKEKHYNITLQRTSRSLPWGKEQENILKIVLV